MRWVLTGMLLVALAGCAPQNGGELASSRCADLVFEATGSLGQGVDDVQATVFDGTQEQQLVGLSPTSLNTSHCPVAGGTEVRMSVETLSANGWAECRITFAGRSVTNRAEGDHAVAECTATLVPGR
jgi:hypothetical protein